MPLSQYEFPRKQTLSLGDLFINTSLGLIHMEGKERRQDWTDG